MLTRKNYRISWGAHRLDLGERTAVMGVVNVTQDSFSDGGKFFNTDAAVAHGLELARAGADILDVGGESTRPYSETVSVKEELRRVTPVIRALCKKISIPVSIDTTKAVVASEALAAGAAIINDISALKADPQMAEVAARADVPVILVHMAGTPQTMQIAPTYANVVLEVKSFLKNAVSEAQAAGIAPSKIMVDPGIGFGKTVEHNLLIIAQLNALQDLDVPILVGSSRKSFIQKILTDRLGKTINAQLPETETGTQATVAAAILNGAHILRVHDVYSTTVTAGIMDAMTKSTRMAAEKP